VIFGGYFTFQVSKVKKNSQQTKKNHWSVPGFLNNNLKKTKGFSPWQKKNWAVQASSGQTLFSTSPFDFLENQ